MCPRGQGRPRGLHLCWICTIKELLSQGNWKIEIQVSFKFNKILCTILFFCFQQYQNVYAYKELLIAQ